MEENQHNASIVKYGTHVVIKKEDVQKYLNDEGQKQFSIVINKILTRRRAEGKSISYHVCNLDEPYADEVQDLILRGEAAYADGNTPEEGWEYGPTEIKESEEKPEEKPEEEELEEKPEEKPDEYTKDELNKLDKFISTLPQKEQDRVNSLKGEKYHEAEKLMEQFPVDKDPEETEDDVPGAES